VSSKRLLKSANSVLVGPVSPEIQLFQSSSLPSKIGVSFEKLDNTDENGIAQMGPVRVAWTKDPAGNWIAFFEQ